MPSTFILSNYAATYQAGTSHANDMIDVATLKIYDGTQPADADTALGGTNHELASFTLPAKASNSVGGTGVITLGAISDTTWILSGTASFARVTKGANTLFDCSVGLAGASPDIIINVNPVTSGAVAHIVPSPTYTVTK